MGRPPQICFLGPFGQDPRTSETVICDVEIATASGGGVHQPMAKTPLGALLERSGQVVLGPIPLREA